MAQRTEQEDDKLTITEDVSQIRLINSPVVKIVPEEAKDSKDGVFVLHNKTVHYDKRSLFIFSYKNKLRKLLVWLIEQPWFDICILIIILLNSLCLAFYDYSDRDDSKFSNKLLSIFGRIFTVIFLIEAMVKILAMGFVIHKNAYLRDPWNVLDFIVAIIGIVDLLPNVPNLKALRTLRVFRPLKSINAVPSMRRLVSTLIISLPELGSVVVFLFFIFLLFGIFGLYQFEGETYVQ